MPAGRPVRRRTLFRRAGHFGLSGLAPCPGAQSARPDLYCPSPSHSGILCAVERLVLSGPCIWSFVPGLRSAASGPPFRPDPLSARPDPSVRPFRIPAPVRSRRLALFAAVHRAPLPGPALARACAAFRSMGVPRPFPGRGIRRFRSRSVRGPDGSLAEAGVCRALCFRVGRTPPHPFAALSPEDPDPSGYPPRPATVPFSCTGCGPWARAFLGAAAVLRPGPPRCGPRQWFTLSPAVRGPVRYRDGSICLRSRSGRSWHSCAPAHRRSCRPAM